MPHTFVFDFSEDVIQCKLRDRYTFMFTVDSAVQSLISQPVVLDWVLVIHVWL